MNREEVIEVLTNALDGLGTAWIVDEAISAAIELLAEDNNVPIKQPDPITGLVPCEYCKNPKKLMDDGYYQVTPNTKWIPDIGDLVCTPSGEYAIFAIDGCEDDTFLCQGMTTCPMCGRKLTAPPLSGAMEVEK